MEGKTFGQAAATALTSAAASVEQSRKVSPASTRNSQQFAAELEHKRAFLETFNRWETLFKRKDGDTQAEKWLIAEYYQSLGHLSPAGFDVLTQQLKERCVFFPTIKECLDAIRPADRYDYAHPFCKAPRLFQANAAPLQIEESK